MSFTPAVNTRLVLHSPYQTAFVPKQTAYSCIMHQANGEGSATVLDPFKHFRTEQYRANCKCLLIKMKFLGIRYL